MARKSYSTYEAKARFSEILRRVRERGETVTVSYHGQPVAEIRPVSSPEGDAFQVRVQALERNGVVIPAERKGALRAVVRRPGALARFLAERDDG